MTIDPKNNDATKSEWVKPTIRREQVATSTRAGAFVGLPEQTDYRPS